MKKLVFLFMVGLLVAFTAPVLAGDGTLIWTADKTIHLDESFSYTETVLFQGAGNFVFDGEAWAKVQEQQELYTLTLTEISFTPFQTKTAIIQGSFSAATGVANVNQAPGSLNNQANEVAISLGAKGVVVEAPSTVGFEGMFCEAQVVSVQYNGIFYDPTTGFRNAAPNSIITGGFTKVDQIDSSFDGFTGVANINQSAGSINNQGNAVAIAGGVDQVVVKAATDVMLAQNNAFSTMQEGAATGIGNNTTDAITNGSFAGAFGVFNVNQSSGSLNNQKNVVSIAFSGPITR